jgi:glycosyltransferase involved in cell wall biosynthesis
VKDPAAASFPRVLLAAFRFHPVYAGPAIRFKRYAPGLRSRGVKLSVFSADIEGTTRPSELGHRHGDWLQPDQVDGIPVQRVRVSRGSSKRQLFTYYHALARYCVQPDVRPDVVQLLTLSPWSSLWYHRIRRMGIPMVYTATMMPTPGLAWHKRRLDRIPVRFLDCMVVSTSVMRDRMTGSESRVRVEVIPNGVDLERFRPLGSVGEGRALRRSLNLDAESEIVTFVGGVLNRRKGMDVLARAWQRIAATRPAARLVLVGTEVDLFRPGQQAEYLEGVRRSLAGAPGGLERVTFTGPVDNVHEYLQATDVFVFPSRKEGMPNVVPEAFASGIASVLTPFEGLPAEFGRPGGEYVLSRRVPDDLADSVISLLASPGRRVALGRSARAWVECNLDVEDSLDRYAELYRDLDARAGTVQ